MNADLLALFRKILDGTAERTDWLALADAYEESGDQETAATIRKGTDPLNLDAAVNHLASTLNDNVTDGLECLSELAAAALHRNPAQVVQLLEEATLLCAQCSEPYVVTADGVANHQTRDGEVDYDADADHVPYSITNL